MKVISSRDYKNNMGILIDLENKIKFDEYHLSNAVNIPYDKILTNYKELLDKSKKYYIYCRGGIKSKRVVSILEFYGYDVTQVKLE